MLSMVLEKEIKVKIRKEKNIIKKIKELNGKYKGLIHQKDIYFDTNELSLKKEDKTLKIRIENNKKYLIYKGKRKGKILKTREEIEVEIPNLSKIIKILKNLGFNPVFSISKTRKIFSLNKNVTINIDHVNGLGKYLEIEIKEGKFKDVLNIMKKLGLNKRHIIKKTYAELKKDK